MRRTRRAPAPLKQTQESATRKDVSWLPVHGWRLLLLAVVIGAAYSNSFEAGLVFDNAPIISQDPRIREASLENMGRILHGGYWYNIPTAGLYRPVTTFSYLTNFAVFGNGLNPAGYHAVNLAVHVVNAGLVYTLGLIILAESSWAVALALLWALHPLLTESVTN